jgi:hypothetical protein
VRQGHRRKGLLREQLTADGLDAGPLTLTGVEILDGLDDHNSSPPTPSTQTTTGTTNKKTPRPMAGAICHR